MENSVLASVLPKPLQRHKAEGVGGRVTAVSAAMRLPVLPYSCTRGSFRSCHLRNDIRQRHFDSDKIRPKQYGLKNTRPLAAMKKILDLVEEEEHRGSPERNGETSMATGGVEQVLHMVGGNGEISYAKNSRIQSKGIMKAKPIVEEAVKEVYKILTPKKFVAVDLACSSGSNTFLVISEITSTINKICQHSGLSLPEIQMFLNDLPGNDFNSIFRSLMEYEQKIREEDENFVPFFVAGMPGSFYSRLFPSKSVHFFHSSYGQMWLSKVPEGVNGKITQLKKENLYLEQFKEDFSTFLKQRSKELIVGGRMVLTISGRRENTKYKDMAFIWGLLSVALNDMIFEGVLKEGDQNAINFPFHTPSMEEVESIIQMEGSFSLNQVKTFELYWDPFEESIDIGGSDYILRGTTVAKYIRAAAEPLLDCYFEKEIINDLFTRYAKIISTHLKEKPKWVSFILDMKLKI